MNLLHRLIDQKQIDLPEIDPPAALALENAAKANVERYDSLSKPYERTSRTITMSPS